MSSHRLPGDSGADTGPSAVLVEECKHVHCLFSNLFFGVFLFLLFAALNVHVLVSHHLTCLESAELSDLEVLLEFTVP